MTSADLIALLRREQYETEDPKHTVTDMAFRCGWNARANELIALLSQGSVGAGLRELSANAPIAIDTSDGDSGDA